MYMCFNNVLDIFILVYQRPVNSSVLLPDQFLSNIKRIELIPKKHKKEVFGKCMAFLTAVRRCKSY